MDPEKTRPPAIVLGLGVNGLTVARCLAWEGVAVHGASFRQDDIGRWSRTCRTLDLSRAAGDEDAIAEWTVEYARRLGDRPVVFPTSDALALMVARHRDRLAESCRVTENGFRLLESIVRKDGLAARVKAAGLNALPSIDAPTIDRLREWCHEHPGPYLAKPYYVESNDNPLAAKNRIFAAAKELLSFIRSCPTEGQGLIVQRSLQGGDDWLYSVAGLCDRVGRIVVMATKRKVIQYPPDYGITSHGAIPACPTREDEERYFAATRRLLDGLGYHGMFGVEWLLERDTGEIYLTDFNARSLYTTGHYRDCGLNLPYLAYRELCGDDLSGQEETPVLPPTQWIDVWATLGSYRRLRGAGRLSLPCVVRAILRSRSYAIWSWRDPLPGIHHAVQRLTSILGVDRNY